MPSLWQRRLIVITLILVFLILAPSLVFYSMGYRYNLKEHRIQRVGIIVVTHSPRDAQTLVDGQQIPTLDAFLGTDRMRDLLPGTYNVKVSKEGYQDWQKELRVQPEIATMARYVMLFRNEAEINRLSEISDTYSEKIVSEDKNQIALLKYNDNLPVIEVLDTKSGISKFTLNTDSYIDDLKNYKLKQLAFSNDTDAVFVSFELAEKDDLVFEFKSQSTKKLKNISEAQNIKANPKNNDEFFFTSAKILYKYNAKNQQKIKVAENIVDYQVSDNSIYIVKLPEKSEYINQAEYTLSKISQNGKSEQILATNLPKDDSFELKISERDKVAILSKNHILYYSGEDSLVHKVAQDINTFDWSKDVDKETTTGEILLFASNNEISIFDPLIQNNEQITRFGEKIANITWLHSDYKHIIFSVNNQVKSVELDENGGRITNNLVTTSKSNPIILNQDEESSTLYLLDGNTFKSAVIR